MVVNSYAFVIVQGPLIKYQMNTLKHLDKIKFDKDH